MFNKGILLYIDPGTGAMLFSVLMGIVGALFFAIQKLIMKIKFVFSVGKVKTYLENKSSYVIFSDSKRYWNVFQPICDEFEARGIVCEYWTASPDDPALSQEYNNVVTRYIGEGNKAYAVLNLMKADICLSTTPGLDVYQWKRSQNVKYYVHILHDIGEVTLYRMFGVDYYDAILLTGTHQEASLRFLEEERNLTPRELVVVGSTYMDSLKKAKESSVSNESDIHKTTVLLAPSWGENSILNMYGEDMLQALVNTGYRIIVRPHPQSYTSDPELIDRLKRAFPDNELFSWNRDNNNFEVLSQADIMISDFSGVIFDYALNFSKPIIYANAEFDDAIYDAAWIPQEPWNFSVLPKLGRQLTREDIANIKSVIDDTISSEKYMAGRKEVNETAWQYKGEAAMRVVDYLVSKHSELGEI